MNIGFSQIRTLNSTFKGYRKHLVVLTILGIFGAILDGIGISAVIPLLSFLLGESGSLPSGSITEIMKGIFAFWGIPFSFKFLLGFIAVLFLARAAVLAIFAWMRAYISTSFMSREGGSMLQLVLSAPWLLIGKYKTGYIQNTIYWDVRKTANLLEVVAQFIQSGTGVLIYFVIALNISFTITVITFFAGIVLLFLLYPLVRKTVVLGEETSNIEKRLTQHLIEYIAGLKTVKASGVDSIITQKGRELIEVMRGVYMRTVVTHSLGINFIQPFSVIFIIILFGIAYKMPGFNLPTFIATLYLIQKIFTYMQSTQASLHSVADLIPFAVNIGHFKDSLQSGTQKVMKGSQHFRFEKELVLEDISLSYHSEIPALSHISCTIEKGSFVGIIGKSGSGKTTMADLMLRLIPPSEGVIRIDGEPIDNVLLDEWRKEVGYVSHDLFLFNASIEENIRFYRDFISKEDIEHAARQSHIFDEIMYLPEGFKTVVGDRGFSLSAGQKQRIVLARALAQKPSVLVLDEATSSLDSESERAIQQAIDELRGRITFIVIAHRISTITSADKIVVLENGNILEEGSPIEMLKNGDSYLSRMKDLQG